MDDRRTSASKSINDVHVIHDITPIHWSQTAYMYLHVCCTCTACTPAAGRYFCTLDRRLHSIVEEYVHIQAEHPSPKTSSVEIRLNKNCNSTELVFREKPQTAFSQTPTTRLHNAILYKKAEKKFKYVHKNSLNIYSYSREIVNCKSKTATSNRYALQGKLDKPHSIFQLQIS